MPINLNKINNYNQNATKNKPSYFSRHLTGQGKKVGLLNSETAMLDKNIINHSEYNNLSYEFKHNYDKQNRDVYFKSELDNTNKTYKITSNKRIPLSPINSLNNANLYKTVKFNKLPNFINNNPYQYVKSNKSGKTTLEIGILPKNLNIQKTKDNNDEEYTNFIFSTALVLKLKSNNSYKYKVEIIDNSLALDRIKSMNQSDTENKIYIIDNFDPYKALNNTNELASRLKAVIKMINQNYNFDNLTANTLFETLQNNQFNLVENIEIEAKDNNKNILKNISNLFKFTRNTKDQFKSNRLLLMLNYELIKHEEKKLSDKQYKIFFNRIKYQTIGRPSHKKEFKYNEYQFNRLLAVNNRLSLISQLNQLATNKNVYQFNPKNKELSTKEHYSPEQLDVIHTTNPYTVIIAGAGSGKSHTILGRIAYLVENHIPLENILLTTFTNAGANNIIHRFNNHINSLTNANLFHKIYQQNFEHSLTKDETLVNLLKIIPDNSKLMNSNKTINDTRLALIRYIGNSIPNGFQKVDSRKVNENLVALINENLDDVINILNTIKDTSLLLEPIIINALMQNNRKINIPESLNNIDFIITDESQDTSTFEYILLLQLARINNSQIMIVGDSNQTLYEFRNANPEFLNALEKSDTFKCYTMSTNYRSQQSILSLTNQLLNVLKTNEYSKLQLHSNNYVNLTEKSFKNVVTLANLTFKGKAKNIDEKSSQLIDSIQYRSDIRDWIINQYKNENQIAIMAFRNRDAQNIGEAVQNIITQNLGVTPTVGYTRKPQPNSNTWLSRMLSSTMDQAINKKINNGHVTIKDLAISYKSRLQYMADKKKINTGEINEFAKQTVKDTLLDPFIQSSLKDFNEGKIPYQKVNGRITMKLIKAETMKNNVKRYVNQQNDNDTDWHKADIVISTIHSAKGLEFPSTICYFNENQKESTKQSSLRLYGVALTRAKSAELILNKPKEEQFGHNLSDMFTSPMRTAYARVIDELKQNDN